MRDQNSEYISKLKLEDFKILLQEFDIEKLTSEFTCQKIIGLLNNYFKPLLKI